MRAWLAGAPTLVDFGRPARYALPVAGPPRGAGSGDASPGAGTAAPKLRLEAQRGGDPRVGVDGGALATALDPADLLLGHSCAGSELSLGEVQITPAGDEGADEAVLELLGSEVANGRRPFGLRLGLDLRVELVPAAHVGPSL